MFRLDALTTMLGLVALAAFASTSQARAIKVWTYQELFEGADLVVLARAVSDADAGYRVTDKPLRNYLVGVLTTFEVEQVVKGGHEGKELVVFHYRMSKDAPPVENGPLLVSFQNTADSGGMAVGAPTYLLFLKRRADGRYECVSGQIDPALSVSELSRLGRAGNTSSGEPPPPPRGAEPAKTLFLFVGISCLLLLVLAILQHGKRIRVGR
jgi:hypothetical protein